MLSAAAPKCFQEADRTLQAGSSPTCHSVCCSDDLLLARWTMLKLASCTMPACRRTDASQYLTAELGSSSLLECSFMIQSFALHSTTFVQACAHAFHSLSSSCDCQILAVPLLHGFQDARQSCMTAHSRPPSLWIEDSCQLAGGHSPHCMPGVCMVPP